ncbi:MAG: hypothetical protein N2117_07230 [Anaerolineales bacterium]|nr:hypothetical protein [Anaerolineales bacterium]
MEPLLMGLIPVLMLLLFAGIIWLAVTAARKERESKAQIAQMLGMTPLPQPEPALLEQIAPLYRTALGVEKYKLRHVSRRILPDGELFLFDLVDTSGDGESTTENQAIAIRSDTLRLPPFQLYPKLDTKKYALGGLANAVVAWSIAKVGTPVQFPESPAFQARYAVTSTDPEAVRRFFDEAKTRYFASTENYTLNAGGHLFTFAEVDLSGKKDELERISRRINRALEIYRLFRQA